MGSEVLSSEAAKQLEFTLKNLEKSFGKGTISFLGGDFEPIDSIGTGSIGLNVALGIGGVPQGRIIEIYGPESSSKTTTALHIAAEAQKQNKGIVAFIDAEHALDPVYARNIGVNLDNLLLSQPDYGEQALEIVEQLVRSSAVSLIIVDSVAALTPKVELEGEMTDQQVGVQARLMSKALRKLTGIVSKTNTTIIFINQIRMKIGMMGYGSPETTTGGNALKFYSSVRIDVRRISTLKVGEKQIGIRVRAKVIKNKVAPPFAQAEYDVMFGEGISKIGEIIDYGVKFDIIDKAGAWFAYNDTKIGQGREKVKVFLKENPEIAAEIEEKINAELSPKKMIEPLLETEEQDD